MKKFWKIALLGGLVGLGGCAARHYEKPVPALIVFKTPTLKYADQGFVYRSEKGVKVQIYLSGRAAFELYVGKRLCVDGRCMGEEAFYRKFFHTLYPKGTLAAILSRRPIFGGEALEEEQGRSVQRIEEPGRFDIIYAFDSKTARFKDRLNHILIKITEIP